VAFDLPFDRLRAGGAYLSHQHESSEITRPRGLGAAVHPDAGSFEQARAQMHAGRPVMSRRKLADRRTLPSIVKVGVYEYSLLHWDPKEADEKECLGICDRFTKEIKVRDDIPDSSFAETLEHEINHACWDAAALKSRATEETVVNRLTPFLLMARRDNPEIYAWIDRAIAQKA